jgi:diguanylate cyclase (GGDEF)-like protein/PAS domain S-box-containing protein
MEPDFIDSIPFWEIVTRANDIIIVTKANPLDPPGPTIVFVNEAFTRLTGYTAEEALGRTPRILQGKLTDKATKSRIKAALIKQVPIKEKILNYTKTGNPYWLDISLVPLRNDLGEVTHFAAIERDITETVLKEKKLLEESLTDALTGLNNRRGFTENAGVALLSAMKQSKPMTLAMIDIDHFKKVNDTFGHEAGDLVLKALSDTFRGAFRTTDIVGRLGGEEFVLLLADTKPEECRSKLERLRQKIERIEVRLPDERLIRFTTSIGLAEFLGPQDSLSDLLKRADQALYKAKSTGRNKIVVS